MKKRSYIFIFSVVIAFTSIRLFSFVFIPDRIYDYIELFIFALIILLYVICSTINKNKKNIFGPYIAALIALTLISSIPAKLFHEQSFFLSFLISRTLIYWIVYYIIIKLNASEYKLEKLIVFIGITWSIIMVIQQITFPTVWFNLPTVYFDYFSDIEIDFVQKLAEERAGVIRIMILGVPYAYFLIFYSWTKLNENFKLIHFFIFILTAVALSLTGSRQIVFIVVLILTLDFFLFSQLLIFKKTLILFSIAILIFFIYPLVDNYFTSLIEVTQDQKVFSNNYIRVQEINFFLFDYYPNSLCYFFGNGWEHSLSSYGNEMINMNFFRSDVGLIGALNKFGIIYIVVVLMIYWKILIPKKKIIIPHHIRLLFIFLFLTSFTGVNYFEEPDSILLFVFIFYIIGKHNENSCNTNTNPQSDRNNQGRVNLSLQGS